MRIIPAVSALLLLISVNVLAGSEYDKCIREEKKLKGQENVDCSGLSYLLDPSTCFKTRNALNEYTSTGKCKKIGVAENVDFGTQPVSPAKKTGSVSTTAANKSELEVPSQSCNCELLQDEHTRLKEENIRLKTENELLKKTSR